MTLQIEIQSTTIKRKKSVYVSAFAFLPMGHLDL